MEQIHEKELQSKNLHNYVVESLINNNKKYVELFAKINASADFSVANDIMNKNKKLTFEAFGNYSAVIGNYSDLIIKKMMGVANKDAKDLALKIIDALNSELKQAQIHSDDFTAYVFAAHAITNSLNFAELDKTRDNVIVDFFQAQKELMLNEIKEPLKLSPQLNILFNDLFTKSGLTVSVEFAESLNLIKNKVEKRELIMHDVIVINNFLYKTATFNKSGDVELISSILKSEEYQQVLSLAMEKFDKQKYALLYIESILSNIGKIAQVDTPVNITIDNILNCNDSTFDLLRKRNEVEDVEKVDVVADEEVVDEKPKSHRNSTYPINGNDSIHTYIFKTFWNAGLGLINESAEKDGSEVGVINYETAFLESAVGVFGSEYQQEISNILANGIQSPFTVKDKVVWTMDKINLTLSKITTKINDLNVEFEKNIKIYLSNLPEAEGKVIIGKINDLISKALILTANEEITVRGLLIEQLNENKIFTHKQLNQFIEVMEKCEINTSHVDKYVDFVNFIESNKTINDNLQLSITCNELQNKQQFFVLISKYLKHIRLGVKK